MPEGSTVFSTNSEFNTAINNWFIQCTLAGNTLTENTTTGTVYTTYGLIKNWRTTNVTNIESRIQY